MSLLLISVASCSDKKREQLAGIWHLQLMDINGTQLQGSALGNWLWEFNMEGGYLTDIAGAREKGRYEMKESQLKLQPVMSNESSRPGQTFTIAKLDSLHMNLVSIDGKNKTALYFTKIKASEVVGEKD